MKNSLLSGTVLLGIAGLCNLANAQLPPLDSAYSAEPVISLATNVVQTEQVHAELVVHAPAAFMPGTEFQVGLLLKHAPGWHTYWKNPGDSGLPTQLTWKLPEGMPVGPLQWPVPEKIDLGPLANYGYQGEVLLAAVGEVAFRSSMGAEDRVLVRLKADWVACRIECIPQSGTFELALPASLPTVMHAEAFSALARAQPSKLELPSASATVKGDRLQLVLPGLPAQLHGKPLEIIPETPGLLKNMRTDAEWTQKWTGKIWQSDMPWLAGAAIPAATNLVVLRKDGTGGAWRIQVAPTAAAENELSASDGLLGLLIAAFVGGLLLNLMPCVFPVLALKLMGFAANGRNTQAQRDSGMAYTAGVLLTFLALGGLLMALRGLGAELGWGFQLQSPVTVALMALLFTLAGLNLLGAFEIRMLLPQRLANLRSQKPMLDSFFSGVLAVAVASPCTAPFMAASLGVGLTLPAYEAMWLFAAMGLGMSSPFLLAAWVPKVASFMPEPGPWMETFKRAMALPMLFTVVWLLWVSATLTSLEASMLLLAFLVGSGFLAMAIARRDGRRVTAEICIALAALVGVLGFGHQVRPAAVQAEVTTSGWTAWSKERLDQELDAGHTVLVDFTASWCITCQYNKKTVLADQALHDELNQLGVVRMRADWTKQDVGISQELAILGRSGVPVYAVYQPGRKPLLLTEFPSKTEIIQAVRGDTDE